MTALPRHSPPPPLVGRDRELAALRAQLAAVLAGHGGLVLIGGEAGIGKTALAAALCDEARTQGACVLVGRCYDLSETPPYGPWTEARSQFSSPSDLTALSDAGSIQELFAAVRAFFAHVVMRQPLLLLLDERKGARGGPRDYQRAGRLKKSAGGADKHPGGATQAAPFACVRWHCGCVSKRNGGRSQARRS